MRALIAAMCFVAMGEFVSPAFAQTGAAMVGKGPGVAGAMQTVKVAGTITAIDPATRAVTIKGPQGHDATITAGPEVKNFAQMKVGDQVNVEYVEALTLELKKGGKAIVARTEQAGMGTAKPGERPAGMVGRQVTITADVIAVDAATQMVTLKGPRQTVDLEVRDPEQFKLIKVGDQVEANYTEALAISVEPAVAKK
jgi:Cu/Ag efflux protein CusF